MKIQPWRVWSLARAFAELHFAVHQCSVPELRPAREAIEERIQNAAALPPDLRRAVLRALAQLPDGDCLCHQDFHPDQIIVSPKGLAVIDWEKAVRGHPSAGVAKTSLLLRFAALPASMSLPRPLRITAQRQAARRLLHAAYIRRYLQLSTVTQQQLAAWEAPLAAARLSTGVPEETERLLALIRARLDLESTSVHKKRPKRVKL